MAEDTATIPMADIDVAQARLKPHLVSVLFFDYVNVTASNKLNLLGIFDRIRIKPETKRTHAFGLFVRTGQTLDGEIVIKIFDANATVTGGVEYVITAPENVDYKPIQSQAMLRIEFDTPVEGVYWFDVSYNGDSLGGAALLVEFRKPEGSTDEHTSGDA